MEKSGVGCYKGDSYDVEVNIHVFTQSVHSCLDKDGIYGIVKETISLLISVVKCVESSNVFDKADKYLYVSGFCLCSDPKHYCELWA